MEHVLKAAKLAVGAGALEVYGVNVKRLGVFVKVLEHSRRFKEVVSK